MSDIKFIAVFLTFGGLFGDPGIDIIECTTRKEAEAEVEYYAPQYSDSFVMTRQEFEAQYGPL